MSELESPDPIAEPQVYHRFLLSALGDDDPGEAHATAPARMLGLVADAGDLLRVRPEPIEWSVLECIGHVADAEIVMSGRYRFVVAQQEPPLIGYDQDLWVTNLRRNEDDLRPCWPASRVFAAPT